MQRRIEFFEAASAPDTQEEDYAAIANQVLCSGPSTDRRIHLIAFSHKGGRWVATLGQRLIGTRRVVTSKRRKVEEYRRVEDSAVIRSIFGPHKGYQNGPFVVATDSGVSIGIRSEWENPFFAQPDEVIYFAH